MAFSTTVLGAGNVLLVLEATKITEVCINISIMNATSLLVSHALFATDHLPVVVL